MPLPTFLRQFLTPRRLKYGTLRKVDEMTPCVSVNSPDSVSTAVRFLQGGGVIGLPTDTVYGLACCATNTSAIDKLYSIKARNEDKPIAICVGRVSDVQKWTIVEHLPHDILTSLLPGPVTVVLKCIHKLDKSLNCNGKIGVRIPDHDFIRSTCNGLGIPVALTSANVSGEPSSVTVDEFRLLWGQLSGVFDGGVLGDGSPARLASTVVDLSCEGFYSVIREGVAFNQTIDTLESYGLMNMSAQGKCE